MHTQVHMFSCIPLSLESKVDGHVYKDARTYMLLELELSNPLVPKRPASVIAEK